MVSTIIIKQDGTIFSYNFAPKELKSFRFVSRKHGLSFRKLFDSPNENNLISTCISSINKSEYNFYGDCVVVKDARYGENECFMDTTIDDLQSFLKKEGGCTLVI